MTAEETQGGGSCDTIQIRILTSPIPSTSGRFSNWRRACWRAVRAVGIGFAKRWEHIWPPLVGCLLGISAGTALVLLFLTWWLNA